MVAPTPPAPTIAIFDSFMDETIPGSDRLPVGEDGLDGGERRHDRARRQDTPSRRVPRRRPTT